ncbi:MAG: hypothetical protein B7X86_17425 [Sphingobacteriales bacterium 17-39-43]|jgi:hypothetical protein|uniref:hypothetical protein n=1 Tax=Daejeonella sp. TaxID=2805397 RepID=UPI000BC44A3A|nr:hypothetical protein [Daejeonella sp.]OYZ27525.1 MAG: hypothetical protein B7Y24_17425 [Sphingobacteriales bacterium 16-39-50]OZA21657.1 MAG: hypothetical protein B7X86_17425 [Sphingobacteriales bacterium 17-39-43]HQS05338.1 hypothetical protein [Daejeonella sp.]HQS51401.1 hypothetical protein [Daejeonella sp.]HQT24891.1 hypothetical protein [Daejeonella sp.]
MKKIFYKGRFVFFPLIGIAFLSLVSYVVMLLWNNLLPEILGVRAISFWQAMGIFILSKILFGFGKGGKMGSSWKRSRMAERFKEMSPEEQEQFKAKMQHWKC